MWAAPYTNDPTTLSQTAKKLTSLTVPSAPVDGIAQNGLYAVTGGDHTVQVIRSDGAKQVVDLQATYAPTSYMTSAAPLGVSIVTSTSVWGVISQNPGTMGVAFVKLALDPWP